MVYQIDVDDARNEIKRRLWIYIKYIPASIAMIFVGFAYFPEYPNALALIAGGLIFNVMFIPTYFDFFQKYIGYRRLKKVFLDSKKTEKTDKV